MTTETVEFYEPTNPSTITCLAGGAEMLKVGPDGFWVRGVKVEQDANEAQKVYEGFKAWMAWAVRKSRRSCKLIFNKG